MKPIEIKRKMLRFQNGNLVAKEDAIVTEYPLTVKLNGEEWVTMVCSPEYMEDLTIGFLASEGVIKRYENIDELWLQEKEGFIHVKTREVNPFYEKLQNKRYITSCCGASRQGFVFAYDALGAKKIDGVNIKLSIEDAFRLMSDMEKNAKIFQQTGGVHNAALCDQNAVLLTRMDIGRHNALDKIYGHCLKNDIEIHDKIIAFSGRISSEILVKVAKIGCEIILSKSAPTELALELAEHLGITTIGFIRGESLNIYTCPERILVAKGLSEEILDTELLQRKKSI
ncbi:formate dehydrogenase accessory sulfurtransferase FdhD [Robertmurraya massiliosenegalensis]|uniref:formate dehydrogenase accessory sulfurtransferase FdhD n=1 Tax=Robertmurraya TaxID=2837507 RepID=UPI0039A52A44